MASGRISLSSQTWVCRERRIMLSRGITDCQCSLIMHFRVCPDFWSSSGKRSIRHGQEWMPFYWAVASSQISANDSLTRKRRSSNSSKIAMISHLTHSISCVKSRSACNIINIKCRGRLVAGHEGPSRIILYTRVKMISMFHTAMNWAYEIMSASILLARFCPASFWIPLVYDMQSGIH